MNYFNSANENFSLRFDTDGNVTSAFRNETELNFASTDAGIFQVSTAGSGHSESFTAEIGSSDIDLMSGLFDEINQRTQLVDYSEPVVGEWARVVTQQSATLPSDEKVFSLLKLSTLAAGLYACALDTATGETGEENNSACDSSTLSYANLISKNDSAHNADFASTVGISASQCSNEWPIDSCADLIGEAATEVLIEFTYPAYVFCANGEGFNSRLYRPTVADLSVSQ